MHEKYLYEKIVPLDTFWVYPEAIIWNITMFGTAALFFLIGVYAQKREKPMWFWLGTEVKAGIAEVWSLVAALVILILGGTVGFAILVYTYRKFEKKYRV